MITTDLISTVSTTAKLTTHSLQQYNKTKMSTINKLTQLQQQHQHNLIEIVIFLINLKVILVRAF